MSDAMHRMTVLASAFARIATQFTELATELSTVQPAAEQASAEAIEQAVAKRFNDAQFLRRLSPFVMEEIDFESLAESVADKIDTDDVARLIGDNIDTDEIVRSVTDAIDCADIARDVASNIDAADIAEEIDNEDVAARIDLTCLANALLERSDVVATLASEMVVHRYEAQLREQKRREEQLKHQIEQLRQATTEYHKRMCESETLIAALKTQLTEAHRATAMGDSMMKGLQAETEEALSSLVDACIDAEAERAASRSDHADTTDRQ